MGSHSLASGGEQILDLPFKLEKQQFYTPGILLFHLPALGSPSAFFRVLTRGSLP